MKSVRIRALLIVLAAILLPFSLTAAPGDLDIGYYPVLSGGNGFVCAAVSQPDGKMIICGDFTAVNGITRRNIARLNVDGSLDAGFDPDANGNVYTAAVQADGKIVIGGFFTSVAGMPRSYVARVDTDGHLDLGFDPAPNDFVYNVMVQADGKILLGGRFTALQPNGAAIATPRNYLARLDAGGSLDSAFNPNPDGTIATLAVESAGSILLGGSFTHLQPNGAPNPIARQYVARIDAAGNLDTGFDPKPSASVGSIAVEADGSILLGGNFSGLQPNGAPNPTVRNYVARVFQDGSLDGAFDPNPDSTVLGISVQADGKILLGGYFTHLQPNGAPNPTTRNYIARVNAGGSLDTGFDPNPDGETYNATVQTDGKIVLGGYFTSLQPNGAAASTPRSSIARVLNDVATGSLAVPDATQVRWQRGGASPEISQVTFELSTNGGTTWNLLGNGSRSGVDGSWRLTGLSLPASGMIRARGRTSNGYQNAGSGLVESVLTFAAPVLGNSSVIEGPLAGSDSVVLKTTPEDTAWTASANDSWLHIIAGSESGIGSANVIFSFDANSGATRTGTLTIAGQTLTVTQAGSGYVAAGGTPSLLLADLNDPRGVAVDGAGNVFIADRITNAITKWTAATQAVTTLISAGLDHPEGVAVDGDGNLYIADSYSGDIKKWTAATQSLSTIAHVGSPAGVAVDGSGNVYFSDYGHGVVQKWTAATQLVSTVVTGLDGPTGVAVDAAGNVYVADYFNLAVKKWTAATQTVSTLISSGVSYPQGVAVDGSGNVYVADSGNRAVKKWTAATQTLTTIVSSVTVAGVAVDGTGNLFFTDYFAGIKELPRAFVDPSAKSVGYAAGSDMLPSVLPGTQNLLPPFAPSSDDPSWLTIDSISNGVVHFSFPTNTTATARTAHVALLGRSIAITQAPPPPAGLTYSTNPATYGTSVTIADNTPSSTGGAVDSYSVSPALPAGLSLNATTGVVSGTPTTVTAAADYTITGSNSSGMTTAVVNITVTDKTPPTIAAPTAGFTPLMVYAGTLPDFRTQAVVSDNVGTPTVSQSPQPGSATVAGVVMVTLTATDAAGNTASTDFSVVVRPLNAQHTAIFVQNGEAPGRGTNGLPSDATLASLGVPATDDDGDVAFLAKWASQTAGKGSGLFLNSSCLGIVGGDAATATGTSGAKWKSFTDPVVSGGSVVSIAGLSGVAKPSASAVVSNSSGSGIPAVVARTGDVAPGGDGTQSVDGAKFKTFKGVAVSGSGTVGILAELIGGAGTEKATPGTDLGLWIKDGTNPLRLALREGQSIGGKTIKTLVSFLGGDGSPGQGRGWLTTPYGPTALALVTFIDKSQAVVSVTPGGGATVYSETGKTGTDGGPAITDATFDSYSVPATNNRYTVAFLASMTVGQGNVTKADARGIFLSDGTGKYTPVARVGNPAGTTGANFSVLKDPVLSGDDGIAFTATLKGGTVKGLAAQTLWWQRSGGSPALLAQGGARPGADLPADAQWKSFSSLAIAANRGPIFAATLVPGKGGVIKTTASGVWACDFLGNPRLLFRTGDPIDLGGGTPKMVKSFKLLNATVGSTGVTRSFNDAAQVVWLATFIDKTTAIVTTDVP